MRIVLALTLLASVSWAQESSTKLQLPPQPTQQPQQPETSINTLSTTTGELEKPSLFKNTKVSGRVSLMTAQAAHPVTYRHLKTTGVDDNSQNSSGSERTTAPNLRYLSANTSLAWTEKHETTFGLVKSLSPIEDRNITTPFGVRFTMPGEIIFLRQSYNFTPNYSASVSGGYTDIAEYRDPSLSFGYQSTNDMGFAPRWSLSASAPTTPNSYKNGLITKASLRTGFGYRAITWGSFANVSFNQGFYNDVRSLNRAHGVTASNTRHPGAPGAPGGRPTFDTTDLVMSEAEIRRTSTNAGVYFYATPAVRLITSLGLSRVDTVKGNEIWLTAVRPIGLQYRLGPVEASADVLYYSNVAKYKSPSMPENLSVGASLAMNFGDRPTRR